MLDLCCAPGAIDVGLIVAHFREHGWARVGRIASEATLALLRERAHDITTGRVVHQGLFFQADSPTGRYQDLVFGNGWEGPKAAYRKLEKLELDPLFREWLSNPAFERIALAVLGP
jgi:hypothetical protein